MLVRSLHWDHAQEYLEAPRRAWRVEGQLFGYVRKARGLVRVLVRCSGHEVGYLNPLGEEIHDAGHFPVGTPRRDGTAGVAGAARWTLIH
ncbi:hypothetical protein E2C01_014122 [Portunus trituberculatus]|uniref:Uncharacterized protein n=1 Tax=Portunus trituberculatus TaxID=210409 RepID=A0A5B7DJD4_PORTR|nr:hypothetical protein [Portunus trituberculatus]